MGVHLLPWLALATVGWPAAHGSTVDQYSKGLDWLSRYGYLPPTDPRASQLQSMEGIKKAIRTMQHFGGIAETGVLDEATLELMAKPRCSLPDVVGREDMLKRRRRRRRYALSGLKWDKKDLTWSVHSYPSGSPSLNPGTVDQLLRHALKAWSDVTPLHFTRLTAATAEGDIRVSFARSLHDDGYPFDGPGGTLAHAFFPGRDPVSGDTHFDDDETWDYGGRDSSTDLFTVAVHEFGHALGLSHSSSEPSIMRPYYQGPVGNVNNYRLPPDDTMAVRALYGVKDSSPVTPGGNPDLPRLPSPPPPRTTQHWDPSFIDRCEGGFDAVANIRGEVFFFKGDHFWRTKRDGSLLSLNPAVIRRFWLGLPQGLKRVDAVYERKSDNSIVFFIGAQYWVFRDTIAMEGYPRPLSDWGLTGQAGAAVQAVEAAFVWAHNGKTYLFSGGDFWRLDESQAAKEGGAGRPEPGYPRDSALWRGVPSHPDDVISWGAGDSYFFKDNLYWVLKSGGLDQDNVTPKSTAVDWLRCPAPAPTRIPENPDHRDCLCQSNLSSGGASSNLLILSSLTVISIINELLRQ